MLRCDSRSASARAVCDPLRQSPASSQRGYGDVERSSFECHIFDRNRKWRQLLCACCGWWHFTGQPHDNDHIYRNCNRARGDNDSNLDGNGCSRDGAHCKYACQPDVDHPGQSFQIDRNCDKRHLRDRDRQ